MKRKIYQQLLEWKARDSKKFASWLAMSYVVHTGAYAKDQDPVRLPVYLLPFML